MSTITISQIKSANWQQYKKFRLKALQDDNQAFGASLDNMMKKPDIFWQNQIDTENGNAFQKVLFAFFDKNIVGMIIIKFSKYKKLKHIARISSFYVDPEYRGQKIGKTLFQSALDEIAKHKEIEKVKLTVNTMQTTAISLYKNHGFQEAGRLSKEFKIDDEYFDVYVMEKLL